MVKATIKSIKQFAYEALFYFGEISKGKQIDTFPGDENTYELYDINGNVIKEGLFHKFYSFECPAITNIYKYNKSGRLIWEYSYAKYLSNSNCPDSITTYKYNNNNNLIEKCILKIDQNTSDEEWFAVVDKAGNLTLNSLSKLRTVCIERLLNKYDNQGRIVEELLYQDDGELVTRNVIKYDALKKRTDWSVYSPEDELLDKWYALFDNDGYIIEEVRDFERNNTPKMCYIRDKQKRPTEIIYYNSKDVVVNIDKITYNEYETVEEANYVDIEGNLDHRMIMKYTPSHNLIEESIYGADGKLYSRQLNIFDKNENIIESRWVKYENDFNYKTSKYEFDQFNNWIKRTDFVKDIPEKIIEREIEYYEL